MSYIFVIVMMMNTGLGDQKVTIETKVASKDACVTLMKETIDSLSVLFKEWTPVLSCKEAI